MTDGDGLLAAILARPLDDTPRLVYADWLDDQPAAVTCLRCGGRTCVYGPKIHRDGCDRGTVCHHCAGRGWVPSGAAERAEFIRVQCDLARMPSCCPTCSPETGHRDGCVNGNRGDELRARQSHFWGHGFGGLSVEPPLTTLALYSVMGLLPGEVKGIVRRGFVDELRVPTLATLFGETCSTCDVEPGIRRYPSINGNWIEGPCNVCSGTGRTTPGIAAEVWRRHPVSAASVADMPVVDFTGPTGDDEYRYGFWELPDWLAGAIGGDGILRWRSPDAANTALSDAIVTHGRKLAGLEPLS